MYITNFTQDGTALTVFTNIYISFFYRYVYKRKVDFQSVTEYTQTHNLFFIGVRINNVKNEKEDIYIDKK